MENETKVGGCEIYTFYPRNVLDVLYYYDPYTVFGIAVIVLL